jgi:hypothetical protein
MNTRLGQLGRLGLSNDKRQGQHKGGSIFGGLLVFYLTGRRVFQLAKLNNPETWYPIQGRNELS